MFGLSLLYAGENRAFHHLISFFDFHHLLVQIYRQLNEMFSSDSLNINKCECISFSKALNYSPVALFSVCMDIKLVWLDLAISHVVFFSVSLQTVIGSKTNICPNESGNQSNRSYFHWGFWSYSTLNVLIWSKLFCTLINNRLFKMKIISKQFLIAFVFDLVFYVGVCVCKREHTRE